MSRPFRSPIDVGGYCVNIDDVDMVPLSPVPSAEATAALDELRRRAWEMVEQQAEGEIPLEVPA